MICNALATARRLRLRCTIARVDPTNISSRITVLSNVPCSPTYVLGKQERERWGMATTTLGFRTYIRPQETAITQKMRLLIAGEDFRIRTNPIPVPVGDAVLWELILDDEGL